MKVALHSVSYSGFFYIGRPLGIEEVIVRVADYGYDGVELMAKRPHASPIDLNSKDRRKIIEVASSYGVEIPVLASYSDFSGPDEFRRELNILYVKEAIKLASDLGIGVVRVFAAGMRDVDPSIPYWRQWELCRDGLKEASRFAEEYSVVLALQNHPPIIESYEDVLSMLEEVGSPNLKACIDPELLIWAGDVDPSSDNIEERLQEIYCRVRDVLVHMHIGDSIERSGKLIWVQGGGGSMIKARRLERVLLGTGFFHRIAKPFIKVIKDIGYDRYISYEICSPRYVKHKLVSLEEIDEEVRHGIKYIRSIIS
ncbi:MAG: sugar phosphate isomerase/epimerase family protein [Candidatus Bathyarchaeia archaeon]